MPRQDSTIQAQASEKQALLNSLPSSDEELYSTWKRLEAHKEFLELQEVSPVCCQWVYFGVNIVKPLYSGVYP